MAETESCCTDVRFLWQSFRQSFEAPYTSSLYEWTTELIELCLISSWLKLVLLHKKYKINRLNYTWRNISFREIKTLFYHKFISPISLLCVNIQITSFYALSYVFIRLVVNVTMLLHFKECQGCFLSSFWLICVQTKIVYMY